MAESLAEKNTKYIQGKQEKPGMSQFCQHQAENVARKSYKTHDMKYIWDDYIY